MPLSFTRLLLLLTLLLATSPGHAQTIDTEAATAYWKMTDALRRNEPLTNAQWRGFVALPANKVYVSSIFGDDTTDLAAYRRAIEVVYMPRYDSLRQAKLKAQRWYYVLVNDYKEQEQMYKKLLLETVKNPAYLEKMYTYAYEYLPARNHTRVANLKLGYVAISNDATSQQEGIYFSLRAARDYGRIKPGILEAHEMHHQLRTGKDFGTIAPVDEGVLWALKSAQNEGLADLTDKRVLVEQSADSTEIRDWLLKPGPGVVHKIDSTLQVLAAGGPAAPLKFYRRLTNGSNGHLPGFFMAYTIVRNGLTKPLLDHADDPLAFALLYQKAAQKDKYHQHPPAFAESSVRYLRQLARKYAKPRPAPAAAPAK
jgi:hypothetical protein